MSKSPESPSNEAGSLYRGIAKAFPQLSRSVIKDSIRKHGGDETAVKQELIEMALATRPSMQNGASSGGVESASSWVARAADIKARHRCTGGVDHSEHDYDTGDSCASSDEGEIRGPGVFCAPWSTCPFCSYAWSGNEAASGYCTGTQCPSCGARVPCVGDSVVITNSLLVFPRLTRAARLVRCRIFSLHCVVVALVLSLLL